MKATESMNLVALILSPKAFFADEMMEELSKHTMYALGYIRSCQFCFVGVEVGPQAYFIFFFKKKYPLAWTFWT